METASERASFERIFNDKIKLAKILIQFELIMNQEYNGLIRNIRMREVDLKQINEDETYLIVWSQIMQLYDFFEFGQAKKFGEKIKNFEAFLNIAKRYRNNEPTFTLEELNTSYDVIRELMVLSGFHDLALKSDDGDFEDEES